MHRQQKVTVFAFLRGRQALQQLQQGRAAVPIDVHRHGDVVAAQGRHRHDAGHGNASLFGECQQRPAGGLKRRAGVGSGVYFVDCKHDVRHAQQLRQQRVAACLRQQRHGLRGEVELGDVDQHHGRVAACGGSHHVAGVLLMARSVGNDEFALLGGEIAVGHVNGDALLALGFQAVGEQRQIDGRASGAFFQGVELVGEDGLGVEQQAADQGAFAVVYGACCEETQGAVVRLVCVRRAHQK